MIAQQGWRSAVGTGGGGITELAIQNTIFVSKNGDDATGTRNLWNKPFLTITGAKAVAQAGDCIYVFAGTYNEGSNDIIASDVKYYFELGSIVQCSFEVISDFGVAKNIDVDGYGVFQTLGVNFGKGVIYTSNPATTIRVRYKELIGRTNGYAMSDCASFDVRGVKITTDLQYGAFFKGNITGVFEFQEINTGNASGIVFSTVGNDLVKRNIKIIGGIINSSLVSFGGGTISAFNCFNTHITYENIQVNHTPATYNSGGLFFNFTSGFFYFKNCVLESTIGYGMEIGSTGVVLLNNTLIKATTRAIVTRNSSQVEANDCEINGDLTLSAGSTDGTITVTGTSEMTLNNCEVSQDSAVGTECVMNIQNSNVRLRNCKLYANPAISESIRNTLATAQNIEVELPCVTNKVVSADFTNVIAGTNIIVSANLTKNSNSFF